MVIYTEWTYVSIPCSLPLTGADQMIPSFYVHGGPWKAHSKHLCQMDSEGEAFEFPNGNGQFDHP